MDNAPEVNARHSRSSHSCYRLVYISHILLRRKEIYSQAEFEDS
jgi:hypothetical protein